MKIITLICAGGFSTSLLIASMEEAAKKHNVQVKIRALAEAKFNQNKNYTDVLLLGPQVEYLLDEYRNKYSGDKIKIEVIDSIDYGMMNGEKVLLKALNL